MEKTIADILREISTAERRISCIKTEIKEHEPSCLDVDDRFYMDKREEIETLRNSITETRASAIYILRGFPAHKACTVEYVAKFFGVSNSMLRDVMFVARNTLSVVKACSFIDHERARCALSTSDVYDVAYIARGKHLISDKMFVETDIKTIRRHIEYTERDSGGGLPYTLTTMRFDEWEFKALENGALYIMRNDDNGECADDSNNLIFGR